MDSLEIAIGRRLRRFRTRARVSQAALARAVGVSLQQLQKYEQGAGRIACSRLYELARYLNVPVAAFFDPDADSAGGDSDAPLPRTREALVLAHHLDRIGDPSLRGALRDLYEAFGARPGAGAR